MNLLDSFILGGLQGITEFLPISSSGHLVLGESLLGLRVEDLKSFDVVVHMGTLMAIFVYFWSDIKGMLLTVWHFFNGRMRSDDPYVNLIGYILIGTIPAVFAGLFLEEWIDARFRNIDAVALSMVVVGVVFILGEFVFKYGKKGKGIRWQNALIIGMAQAVALIPGVSRSGSTIVAGLFQGIERSQAARFSFLLAIPAISGAGLLTAAKMSGTAVLEVGGLALVVGFVSAFVFGLLSVSFLMKFLKRFSLGVFAGYLILIGALVLLYN